VASDSAALERVLAGLDAEQQRVVTAPAGPVCVLAGAGTGKTRAITHRIAYRSLRGQIRPEHVLAVTFTARAAGELRDRLAKLGVPGVQARTFHAAAARQLRYFAPRLLDGRPLPEVVETKARFVTQAAAKVGLRSADRDLARDLASEIEWAKATLVQPEGYAEAAARAGREPPLEAETVAAVYAEYERVKSAAGVMDFEDLLRGAIWAIEEHPDVAAQIRAQYRHFVVDEYQDVNPVQQRLLEAWLGQRRDITVVGDASQTIYSFTGASSRYLLEFPRRYPDAVVVRLTRDYRSTPEVVELANTVISASRGPEARVRLALTGQRPSGPPPIVRTFPDEPAEAAAVAAQCATLVAQGRPPSQIAVLFRTNAQSAIYEEALADAGVPYVVRGAERFFDRPEVRRAMTAIRAAVASTDPAVPLPEAVIGALRAVGWHPDQPASGGAARESWEALAALVRLADDFVAASEAAESAGVAGASPGSWGTPLERFHAELLRRAAAQHVPTLEGVTLASLHAAKGLEWDVVFLVGLVDGTIPVSYARTLANVEEERRLLYVGITRAREVLWLSWAAARSPGGRQRRPCRFLPMLDPSFTRRTPAAVGETGGKRGRSVRGLRMMSCRVCGTTLTDGVARKLGRCVDCPSDIDEELYDRLRRWRARVAGEQRVPAYVVFTDATLTALAERRPERTEELVAIPGIGPRKLEQYGDAVLALIQGADPDDL